MKQLPQYQQFIFDNYEFAPDTGVLTLHYAYDDALRFTETYRFDFDFAEYDAAALDRACQDLFLMAGVSYYKMYLAPQIAVRKGTLDIPMAAFFSQTYQQGLGEFFYVNKLDPHSSVAFPGQSQAVPPVAMKPGKGMLVAIGGGKDSLVTVEMLRAQEQDVATWSLNHRPQLSPLVERIGLPHYWVERTLDPQLLELNKKDALNGHIPISAIFACVGSVVAILSGRRDVVVSNEQSANEPTLRYEEADINHQFSKSQVFERAYQAHVRHSFGDAVRYYSFLRPLSELYVAELFAKQGFEKYKDVFSSCNRAFTLDSNKLFWDGTCPKCAFVFAALTPFVPQAELEKLFDGKNLLETPELEVTYRQLLGIEGDKPLECVGEIKESRAAMRLASQKYPELATKYQFELPEDYDFRATAAHEMPEDIAPIFTAALAQLGGAPRE